MSTFGKSCIVFAQQRGENKRLCVKRSPSPLRIEALDPKPYHKNPKIQTLILKTPGLQIKPQNPRPEPFLTKPKHQTLTT